MIIGIVWERPEPRPAWTRAYGLSNDQESSAEIFVHMSLKDIVLIDKGQEILRGSELYGSLRQKKSADFLTSLFYRKNKKAQRVLDLTCGWGRDAIRLAQSGVQVLGFEQNLIPYLFAKYAHSFYFPDLDFQIYYGSCDDYAWVFEAIWPWVYLDPLFAETRPGLSKKEMELLYEQRYFFSSGPSDPQSQNQKLKTSLRDLKIETLVIKQHRHAQPWYSLSSMTSVTKYSRVCRFDLYYVNQLPLKDVHEH